MARPIVVATDFSPHADEALRYTRRFVRGPQPLHLFHDFAWKGPEPYGLTQGQLELADRQGRLHGVIGRTLRHAAERAGMDPDDLVLAHRRHLAAAPAIVAYAREVEAALLVVGTHGRRGVRRFLLGSVAAEVVHTAPCDVLVVPLEERAPWSRRPTRRVLAPVDLSSVSARQVARAGEVAAVVEAPQLDLLHVVDFYDQAWLRLGSPKTRPETEEQLEAEMSRLAGRRAGVATHVIYGTPATEIVAWAARHEADLVVLASHDPSTLDRLLVGSVSERVLRMAGRPTLLVRMEAEAPPEQAPAEAAGGEAVSSA